MSDDDKNGAYDANRGNTLPDRENATHDIELSPLFLNRDGRIGDRQEGLSESVDWRGQNGSYWSANAYTWERARYFIFSTQLTYPSNYELSILGQSLRCLVSTNNR